MSIQTDVEMLSLRAMETYESAIICPERMSLNCFINVKYLKNYDSA